MDRFSGLQSVILCGALAGCSGAGDISTVRGTVALGQKYQCVLVGTGDVRCWGDNDSGALGNDTTTSSAEPAPVLELSEDVVFIDAGPFLACGVTSSGAVQCWGTFASWSEKIPRYCTPSSPCSGDGYNHHSTQSLHALDLPEIEEDVRSLAVASAHLCVLTEAGQVVCYTLDTWSEKPSRVASREAFSWDAPALALAAGERTVCALLEDRSVRCLDRDLAETVVLEGGKLGDIHQVGVLSDTVCALTAAGKVYCKNATQKFPKQPSEQAVDESIAPWVEIEGTKGSIGRMIVGERHLCVIVAGEGVQCNGAHELIWGVPAGSEFFPWVLGSMPAGYYSGELDPNALDPDELARFKPSRLASSDIVDGSAGQDLTCVTTSDSVVCWGEDVRPGEVVSSTGNMTKTQLHPSFPIEIEGL